MAPPVRLHRAVVRVRQTRAGFLQGEAKGALAALGVGVGLDAVWVVGAGLVDQDTAGAARETDAVVGGRCTQPVGLHAHPRVEALRLGARDAVAAVSCQARPIVTRAAVEHRRAVARKTLDLLRRRVERALAAGRLTRQAELECWVVCLAVLALHTRRRHSVETALLVNHAAPRCVLEETVLADETCRSVSTQPAVRQRARRTRPLSSGLGRFAFFSANDVVEGNAVDAVPKEALAAPKDEARLADVAAVGGRAQVAVVRTRLATARSVPEEVLPALMALSAGLVTAKARRVEGRTAPAPCVNREERGVARPVFFGWDAPRQGRLR